MKGFGEFLKFSRKKAKYNQNYVARKINVSQSTYSKFERNITEPTLEELYELSNLLGFDITDLLYNLMNANFSKNENITDLLTYTHQIMRIKVNQEQRKKWTQRKKIPYKSSLLFLLFH